MKASGVRKERSSNRRTPRVAAPGNRGLVFEADRAQNTHLSLLQNSLGSGIYCREELLSLGARASRPHKTWQGRGDWLHRVGRFTRRLTLEQRLDKYAGGTPALPGGNPWLARCRSLSRAIFCRSILPPSHARLRILQKAHLNTMALQRPRRSFFSGTAFFLCGLRGIFRNMKALETVKEGQRAMNRSSE